MTTTCSDNTVDSSALDQHNHKTLPDFLDFYCFKDSTGKIIKTSSNYLEEWHLKDPCVIGKTNYQLAELVPFYQHFFLKSAESDELCWQSGNIYCCEERFTDRDHNDHICEITKIPIIIHGSRHGLIVIGKNKAKRTHLLKEHEKHFQNMLLSMPIMMNALDEKGNFLLWNQECETVSGYRSEEIVGTPAAWNRIYPDTSFGQVLEQVSKENALRGLEQTFVCKDGSAKKIIWFFLSGECFMPNSTVWGFGIDITPRHLIEERLKHREQELKNLLDNTPDTISRFNKDLQCIYVNQAVQSSFGVAPAGAIGKTFEEINFDKEYKTFFPKHIQQVFETKQKTTLEYDYNSPFGVRHYQSILVPEFDDRQEIISVLKITRDLTERKHMQTELARLDRLNLVGEMAASIGHEVRNPLTTVRGFLQMLMLKKPCFEFREQFSLMIDEIDRANSIITEFLSLAKNKTIKLQRKSLSHIVQSIFPLIEANAFVNNHKLKLALNIVPDIFLDEKEIRQLILNLVRNAFDAMGKNGKLTISTYIEDDNIVLAIQDTGPGIPDTVKEKIGTPFITTKETGTGLGLAICYSIAERHRAKITFDTSPSGTTFYTKFKKQESNPA